MLDFSTTRSATDPSHPRSLLPITLAVFGWSRRHFGGGPLDRARGSPKVTLR
jgi:hypothetical protein